MGHINICKVFSIGIANTDEEKQAVYRLRYQSYRHDDVIEPSHNKMFRDEYDDLPSSRIIYVEQSGKGVVGSLRFTLRTPTSTKVTSSEYKSFPDILEPIAAKQSIVCANRLCIAPESTNKSQILAYLLAAKIFGSDYIEADYAIAATTTNKLKFYKHLLGMQQISDTRKLPGLKCEYCLVGKDLKKSSAFALNRLALMLGKNFLANQFVIQQELRKFMELQPC